MGTSRVRHEGAEATVAAALLLLFLGLELTVRAQHVAGELLFGAAGAAASQELERGGSEEQRGAARGQRRLLLRRVCCRVRGWNQLFGRKAGLGSCRSRLLLPPVASGRYMRGAARGSEECCCDASVAAGLCSSYARRGLGTAAWGCCCRQSRVRTTRWAVHAAGSEGQPFAPPNSHTALVDPGLGPRALDAGSWACSWTARGCAAAALKTWGFFRLATASASTQPR